MQILRRSHQLTEVSAGIAGARRCSADRETTVWIGDSHGRFNLGQPVVSARLTRASDSDFVWSIGPRLLHSVADRGWPPDVAWGSRFLRRPGRRPLLRLGFVLGEIDVRVFLGKRVESGALDLSFVPAYVARCEKVAGQAGGLAVLVIPVPPSGPPDPLHEFPRVSSLESRVHAHQELREAIHRAASGRPTTRVFDPTPELSSGDGQLEPTFTDDGFHLNSAGAATFLDTWDSFKREPNA